MLIQHRVRREDLYDDSHKNASDDDAGDSELEARLNAQIAKSLGLEKRHESPAAIHSDTVMQDGEGLEEGGSDRVDDTAENEFEFRLFSTSGPAPKVTLEDDDAQGDGALVNPRPESHYLVRKAAPAQKKQYEYAAISGDAILEQSRVRWRGLELPWKVTTITVERRAKPGDSTPSSLGEEDDEASKRRRPGKKQRIGLRIKERAEKERQEAASKKLVDKEEQVKDKKKRLNRLKKLRKRTKEKEKKQAARGEGGQADADADADGTGSDDDSSSD